MQSLDQLHLKHLHLHHLFLLLANDALLLSYLAIELRFGSLNLLTFKFLLFE